MKKLSICLIIIFCGCASTMVKKTPNIRARLISPEGSNNLSWECGKFSINFGSDTCEYQGIILFGITNKSDKIIKIYWNESYYIHLDNQSHPIIGLPAQTFVADFNRLNKEINQSPSIILPNTSLQFSVTSQSQMYYDDEDGEWDLSFNKSGNEILYGNINLLLVIGTDEGKENYLFKFAFETVETIEDVEN